MGSELASVPQAAAIPLRAGRVCMVTSSSGKRWVIPKGCMEPGKTAGQIALQEAWEEAGLIGVLSPEPVGNYVYEKWSRTCYVTVYLMQVTEVLTDWPEQHLRERRWIRLADASEIVDDAGLRKVLQGITAIDQIQMPV